MESLSLELLSAWRREEKEEFEVGIKLGLR